VDSWRVAEKALKKPLISESVPQTELPTVTPFTEVLIYDSVSTTKISIASTHRLMQETLHPLSHYGGVRRPPAFQPRPKPPSKPEQNLNKMFSESQTANGAHSIDAVCWTWETKTIPSMENIYAF